jgi:hypothetical protein
MVSIANKTIKNYINGLTESDQKKLKTLLTKDDEVLKTEYNTLKENVLNKLESMQETDQDKEVTQRINETIEKITVESFDKLNYFRLQQLNENL